MFTLHHASLCPHARTVRLVLGEKGLDFVSVPRGPGRREDEFAAVDPDGGGPVLVDPSGAALGGPAAIAEYLEELHPEPCLLPGPPAERAEARRLASWFDNRFGHEVSRRLVGEKVMKRLGAGGPPDSRAIHRGRESLHAHLEYASWLLDRRKWLAGETLSVADLSAGAHISSLDYLDDVPWQRCPVVKEWYMRIKSRPSFRGILADRLAGEPPPRHYDDLDF